MKKIYGRGRRDGVAIASSVKDDARDHRETMSR